MTTTRADLLFLNGPILTMDARRPEAEALALAGGRVVAVGARREVEALRGPGTRVVDLAGRAAVPGLADAHVHLVYLGMMPTWLAFSGMTSARQIVEAVRERTAATPSGRWVYGRGWDPAMLAEGRGPTLAELDAAAPAHPVLLSREDGHLCLANTQALRRAGITQETPDPAGGAIGRDEGGRLNGALSEAALYLAWNAYMAELTPKDFRAPLLDAARMAAANGLASVHAVLLENVAAEVQALQEADARDELPVRVYAMVPIESVVALPKEMLGWRGRMARVGAAKAFADGTLFAGTAALREGYADNPASRGETAHTPEGIAALVRQAKDARLQPAVHAVGDRAVELVLDAFEAVYGANVGAARPRIEHATVLGPDLVRRMADAGVIAAMQPRRQPQLERRLGAERATWANPWRALAEAGAMVAASSDAPFLQPQPGVWGAVLEAVKKGLTVSEALAGATRSPAYAAFQERETGMLRPGMRADVTVLSHDPRRAAPDALAEVRPVMTVADGRVAWEE